MSAIIDDFEDGDTSGWQGTSFNTQSSPVYSGNYSAYPDHWNGNSKNYSNSSSGDLQNYPQDGDTLRAYVYVPSNPDFTNLRLFMGDATTDWSSYPCTHLDNSNNQVNIKTSSFGATSSNQASTSYTIPQNEWLGVEIKANGGDLTGRVIRSDGTVDVELTASSSYDTINGVSFHARGDSGGDPYLDKFELPNRGSSDPPAAPSNLTLEEL